ncbi:juvenile hormone acid O-methyltransferase-like [Tachypleus tridentatus]|uniref:juvenile hormone acid O-methyltransferase-like n=1 Tax=Tachypleus tridentatus TaxID=6853 RepID=UPI003FD50309
MNSKPAQYCSNRPKKFIKFIDSRLSHYFSKMSGSNWDIVLDFGCGPGNVTKDILLKHCPNTTKIFAVDLLSEFVDFAKETFGHERIEYMVLDVIEKTPPQWIKIFDKVVAFFSLQYVKDVKKFLEIIHGILKPGGYFLSFGLASDPQFSVWLEMSMKEEWKQYFIGVEKYIPATHTSKDYCNEFKKLAEECGFVPIAVTSRLESCTLDSEKKFNDFYESILPEEIVKKIPLEKINKFLEDYTKTFYKYDVTHNVDGTVTVQTTLIEICLQSKISS